MSFRAHCRYYMYAFLFVFQEREDIPSHCIQCAFSVALLGFELAS